MAPAEIEPATAPCAFRAHSGRCSTLILLPGRQNRLRFRDHAPRDGGVIGFGCAYRDARSSRADPYSGDRPARDRPPAPSMPRPWRRSSSSKPWLVVARPSVSAPQRTGRAAARHPEGKAEAEGKKRRAAARSRPSRKRRSSRRRRTPASCWWSATSWPSGLAEGLDTAFADNPASGSSFAAMARPASCVMTSTTGPNRSSR